MDAESVLSAIRSFNQHSGAGPSGLRPLHLKESLGPANADQVLDNLTTLVNTLVRGQAHRDVSPWLCGATLTALPKKDGSSRPVAVGEVLRRLTAKTLCACFQQQAREYLWPLQLGVAQPLGTEVGLQASRQWCLRNSLDVEAVFIKAGFCQRLQHSQSQHLSQRSSQKNAWTCPLD